MNKVDVVEQSRLRKDIPPFRPGDQVKVHVKVVEGQRHRIQVFEGVVLGRRGGGLRESFTVRKMSFGVGVERTFPLHGPTIDKVEIVRHGKVRRAKLYYLRERIGRRAKIDERRTRIADWTPELAADDAATAAAEGEAIPPEAESSAPKAEAAAPEAEAAAPKAEAAAPEATEADAAAPAETAAEPPAADGATDEAPDQGASAGSPAPETAGTSEDEDTKNQA